MALWGELFCYGGLCLFLGWVLKRDIEMLVELLWYCLKTGDYALDDVEREQPGSSVFF